ncbi:MAG: hypothetical protein UY48_C0011G0008 [Candidatus Gottesmanbacteria bacterium GW2011_GWB1_49_7]|uniref:Uncharacterized protein n=1 Tax=Candidatus Gottesmanbacteria bacterium GW2011_GWB1_49_7 TaxID=1618448 RepID=A0A0G1W1D9_9BACT|nr:MAG: hypothetical protein UY48_C0011G0008 [Candidatus Gottesmanbacteria bacterium GW2011_GWB1_49_7]
MPLIIPYDEAIKKGFSISIRNNATEQVLAKALELGIGKNKDSIVVRDAVMGDVTDGNVTDFKDVECYSTAQTSGMENWAQDATDVNPSRDLKSVIAGAGTTARAVKNKAVIGCFGFFDNSPNPALTAIRFKRGSNTLDFWQVEQCYAGLRNGGMINGVLIWEENDPMTIDMNHNWEGDYFVGLNMIVAERYDEVVSRP